MSEFDDLIRQKAVALKYNPDKNGAPVIVASGMGYMAEKITETALAAGVPVYQAIVDIYIYFLGYVPKEEEKGTEEMLDEMQDNTLL